MLPGGELRTIAFLVAFRLTGVTLLYTGFIAFLISHSGQRSLAFLAVFPGTIAFALLSRYLIELPAMSLRRYVLTRPAPVHPEDPPLPLGNM